MLEQALPSQRKTFSSHECRGIDQFVRWNTRGESKELIHNGEPDSGTRTRKAASRNAEIREQPGRVFSGRVRELLDDERQLWLAKAIENKMRDDQVVARCGRGPHCDVFVNETNARCVIVRCLFYAFARQLQHARACIETIHFNSRILAEQFTEKPPIPLAHNERAAWRSDFPETGNSAPLELLAEGDPFQRSIPRRDGIEVHTLAPISTTSGVSKTRSAKAVR